MADGAALETDELSDQVLAVVTDDYGYDVAGGVVSFRMSRAARSADACRAHRTRRRSRALPRFRRDRAASRRATGSSSATPA